MIIVIGMTAITICVITRYKNTQSESKRYGSQIGKVLVTLMPWHYLGSLGSLPSLRELWQARTLLTVAGSVAATAGVVVVVVGV